MQFKRKSFGGDRPIHTNTPVMVPGGFNLDVTKVRIEKGEEVPEGILAAIDEENRLMVIQKTARVKEIVATDPKVVTLESDMFLNPIFCVGESVLSEKLLLAVTKFEDAPVIKKIEHPSPDVYRITLSGKMEGLAVGDVILQVVEGEKEEEDAATNAVAVIEKPYALCIANSEISEGMDDVELGIDASIDSGNGAYYLKRIPPIPNYMLGEGKVFLKFNPNIKFTNSY